MTVATVNGVPNLLDAFEQGEDGHWRPKPPALRRQLYHSGRRWALAALDTYIAGGENLDFAIHHMAVAVEHLAKAYLCTLSDTLIADDRASFNDLLILAGHGDKISKSRADARTVSGAGAIRRVAKLRGKAVTGEELADLRSGRDRLAHLGEGVDASRRRSVLSEAVSFVNDLLPDIQPPQSQLLNVPKAPFWDRHEQLVAELAQEAIDEARLRYEAKLRQARSVYERRFKIFSDSERDAAIAALIAKPVITRWAMVGPARCPACGNEGTLSGRDFSEDFGSWFAPRHFGCRACDLALDDNELRLAGFRNQFLDEYDLSDEERYPDSGESDEGEDLHL